MRKLVRDLMGRAGLSGFTGHNLRDTFATLVTEESGDLTLAMQLIRDKVPGVASRYVKRDLPALLERYSPVRQLERKPSPLVGENRTPSSSALAGALRNLSQALKGLADALDAGTRSDGLLSSDS